MFHQVEISPPRAPSRAAPGFAGCGPPDGGPGGSVRDVAGYVRWPEDVLGPALGLAALESGAWGTSLAPAAGGRRCSLHFCDPEGLWLEVACDA